MEGTEKGSARGREAAGNGSEQLHKAEQKADELMMSGSFLVAVRDLEKRTTAVYGGATWAETFKYRYGFGIHDLRSYVVTQMMKCNINPFYLHAITGHRVPGTSAVSLDM